jgi:hypothetical protein
MQSRPDSAYFELAFKPNVELVSVVRRFVSQFYDRVAPDADTVSRVALATHELLENAVKYSRSRETILRVEVIPDVMPAAVLVRTWNHAEPQHCENLRRTVASLSEAVDPNAHYLQMMRASSKRAEGSELGLARIMAEAEMKISLEEGEEGRVGISASTPAWGETS